jgi:hypothetical protein
LESDLRHFEGKCLKAGHVRIKKRLMHRSLLVHLLFRKSFRHLHRPTFRIQHCSALGACTCACNSNKQIPNSSSRCVLHAVHQFIYSHDSSVSWRSCEVCKPPDSSDLPRSRLLRMREEKVSSRSHPRDICGRFTALLLASPHTCQPLVWHP